MIKQGETTPVPGGCHPTKEKARAHQRALYASESADADRFGVYAFAVSEGSDMTENTASNQIAFSSTNVAMPVLPIFSSSGQTIGFVNATPETSSEEPTAGEKPWSGILAVIGSPTSDKRFLIPDEIGHRDLPIPLQVQTVTAEGHDGSATAGRIDMVEMVPLSEFDARDDYNLDGVHEDAIIVFASGMLDGSEAALEAERLIKNGAGISIDLPPERMALIDPDTFEEVDPDGVDMMDVLGGKYLTGIGGKIAAATIVTIPAFEEAEIGLEEDSVLVASAHGMSVGFGSLQIGEATDEERVGIELKEGEWGTLLAAADFAKPDPDAFDDPRLKKLTALTITDVQPDGYRHVYGHLADWDGCHAGFSNVCVPPFRSQTDYAYFNTGEIECADGKLVAVGKLMFSMDGGKHADTFLNAAEASKHYDDSTKVGAFVRAGTDAYGTWLAGVVRPGLSDIEVQHLRSHPPSGDWRPIPGKGTELVAAFCVAVGGFPIPRAMVASGEHGELTIITAPLDLDLGPHAVRRRFEVLKRRRRKMRPYEPEMVEEFVDGFRDFPSATRKRMAKAGTAMPDGSFPIANCEDAKNARQAIGRANPSRRAAVKAHIAKRERALGCAKPD